MSNKPQKLGSITDRPKKSQDDEEIDIESTYEDETILDVYERPKTAKELFLQIATAILVVAFVGTSGAMCTAVGTQPTPVEQNQNAPQVDDTAQQIERYSTELAENPNDVTVLANLGYYMGIKAQRTEDATERMTTLKQAEGHLRKALEQDADYTFAQMELGRNLIMQENFEEAEQLIASGLETVEPGLTSDDEQTKNEAENRKAELLRLSAAVAMSRENYQTALEKMNEVAELKPGDPNVYLQRSQLHKQLDNTEEAIRDLEFVIDIGQKTGNPQLAQLGQVLLENLKNPPTEQATPAVSPEASAPTSAGTPAASPEASAPTPAATP